MKVDKYPSQGDGNTKEVVCSIDNAEVSVRQSDDGTCMIVAIKAPKGKVLMEPRAAAIWLVVKPT